MSDQPQDPWKRRHICGLAALGGASLLSLPVQAHQKRIRVISLDYGAATTLLAVGVTPVAVASADHWDRWVVEPPLPASVLDAGQDLVVNQELVASLRPDLIVISPYLKSLQSPLARIAPVEEIVIYQPGGEPLDRAIVASERLCHRVDKSIAWNRYLAQVEQAFDQYAERLSRIDLPPVCLINFMDARHARVYGAQSLYQNVLDRIGLSNAWQGKTNYWGFRTIGLEELVRDANHQMELLVFEPLVDEIKPTLARSPLWRELPVVKEDRYAILPPVLMFGMLPSALRFARLITTHLEAKYS